MSPSNSYCPSLVWTLTSSFFLPHLSFPSWYTHSVITGSLDLSVHTFTLTSGIPATWITLSWTGKSLCNSEGIFDTLNVNYKPVSWHANGKFNLDSKNLHSVVVKSSSSKVSRRELKLQFWNLTLVSYMPKQVIPRTSNSSLQKWGTVFNVLFWCENVSEIMHRRPMGRAAQQSACCRGAGSYSVSAQALL